MQSYAVVYTRLVRADLQRIRTHIGRENPAAATRVAVQLVAACDRLEYLPQRGRPGRHPGTRELTVWPYVIIYRIEADRVVLLRVWHGAQNRLTRDE